MKTKIKINTILLLVIICFLNRCKNIDTCKEMVLIPGGEFFMGSDTIEVIEITKRNPEYNFSSWFNNKFPKNSWFSDQFPKHKVKLDSFYIDRYEVTFKEYKKFVVSTAYVSDGKWEEYYNLISDSTNRNVDNLPVLGVTWKDAMQYCSWIGKRLPTEAEWEYVAKGREKNNEYPWGMKYDSSKANIQNKNSTMPIGSYPVNSFGIHDLGGNVQEWCYDYYDKSYYSRSEYDNPQGPKNGKTHVVRGGAFHLNGVFYARSSARTTVKDSINYLNLVGFRCAKNY